MTKSTITRERVVALIAEHSYDSALVDALEHLLAAMDSEPYGFTDGDRRGMIYKPEHADRLSEPVPVYRHAQPVPVVNGEYGDAYQGAREDLAIWKRRALEAEESVRRLEQINDHLVKEAQGESRMGEPVIAQPVPVVPMENHIGSKNSLDAIVSFIKSKSNPTVKCYEEVSGQLFKDNCHGIHSHVIEYILKLGEELEDLRAEQAEMQPVPVVPCKWIPVSERMPDENAEQQVLACFKGGDISTLYYFEGRWDDAYGIVPIRQDVTHWMPLPAAPQEVKK